MNGVVMISAEAKRLMEFTTGSTRRGFYVTGGIKDLPAMRELRDVGAVGEIETISVKFRACVVPPGYNPSGIVERWTL